MKNKEKNTLYIIILVLAVASITFRALIRSELEQTSLLFVGIPTLITLLVVRYSKKPKSAYGVAFLTVTLFLLICGIFFGEGFICLLFMSPLFYGVTAIFVWLYELLKKRDKTKTYSLIILPILFMLLQPFEYITEPTTHSIKTEKIISDDVNLNVLNKQPDFNKNLPKFFKIGFPKPIGITGTGTSVEDTRSIYFKSNTKGVGKLVLEIKERTDKKIVFKIKSDNTHINHWLTYKEITVEIIEDNNIKKVVWTTDFICDLGPSWYFEPSEKYAVDLMNQHLINSYF